MIVIRLVSGYVSFSICNSIANTQISSLPLLLVMHMNVVFTSPPFFNMIVVSTCSYHALRKMNNSMELLLNFTCLKSLS
jgi:hypothetical protein